jgi:hypothetical protein
MITTLIYNVETMSTVNQTFYILAQFQFNTTIQVLEKITSSNNCDDIVHFKQYQNIYHDTSIKHNFKTIPKHIS